MATRVEPRTSAPVIGGRYRIDGLLGEGGMARVFDAFDERLERRVALKVLRPETEALAGMRQRFQQEARIAARLVHPNIVAVLDYGDDHSTSYLVMEWLPGTTLREEIARGPLPVPRLLQVVTETLAALDAAHRFGVLHRDVKPSNILLTGDGEAKMADFGIAKSLDERLGRGVVREDVTITGVVLGTPGYLAPERRMGHPATVQSDLYAVGAVMVEGSTGRRAGLAPTVPEGLPPTVAVVAGRALAADPRARFESASEMSRALRPPRGPVIATQPVRTTPMRVPTSLGQQARRPRRGRRRRALFAAAAGVLGVAALAASLFVLVVGTSEPTGPASLPSASRGAHTTARTQRTDPERTAISALATALAGGGLPGDPALAQALEATAAQPPGAGRTAQAERAVSLAQVLLDGGGITSGQYHDVLDVLAPTGTTPPAAPTTVPTQPTPGFGGPGAGPLTGPGGGPGDDAGHPHGNGDRGRNRDQG